MIELELLVFTLGGAIMGIDTEQVNGIIPPEQADERGIEAVPFHRLVPFGGRTVDYRSPKALLMKSDPSRAVMIEAPDDIISVGTDAIFPLPATLAQCRSVAAIWAVAVKGDAIVVLVDLDRLNDTRVRQNTSATSQEAAL